MKTKILPFFVLILFLTVNNYYSQTQINEKPLSLTQIESLIKNIDKVVTPELQDSAISIDIGKRGINFQITDEILAQLKNIGAGTKTITSLMQIKATQVNLPKKKQTNNIIIIVAKFEEQNEINDSVTDLIISQLKETTKSHTNVSIKYLNEHITAQDGRTDAISRAKEKEADIIVWGWLRKNSSNIIINSQVEIVSNIPNDLILNTPKTTVEEIPNFNNFSAQLQLSKEISVISSLYLSLINSDLGNYDDAIGYISDAILQESISKKFVDLSELYIFRAMLYLNKTCNFSSESSLEDVNKAIKFGANPDSPQILQILALSNLQNNLQKALEYSEKYYQIAKKEDDKTLSLFLLATIYAEKGDEIRATDSAKKLTNHLLVLPATFENLLYLSFGSLILQDKLKATLYLDKARNSIDSNNLQLYRFYILQGILYAMDNSYELALDNFKKSIQIKPTCSSSYVLLANTYYANNDANSALNTFNLALEIDSNNSEVYLAKGKIYEENEDFERALANYQKAIEVKSNSVEAYRTIAEFYEKRDKLDLAIFNYSKILSFNKDDEETIKSRAELYLKTDNFDLAIADFRVLFSKMTQRTNLSKLDELNFKGILLKLNIEFFRRNNYELGIEFSNKYIQVFPKDVIGYEINSEYLESKGSVDLAIEAITRAIRLDNNNSSYFIKRALLWKKNNNYTKTLEDIDQAIRINRTDKDALQERAKLYLENNKYDLAIEDYINLFSLMAQKSNEIEKTKSQRVILNLSSLFLERGRYEDGIRITDKYIQFFPKDDLGYQMKSFFLDIKGEINLAIEAISQAISLKSDNSDYYDSRASFLKNKGSFDKALEDINLAIKLVPNKAKYYKTRSEIYEKNGDIKSAIESLEKAIDVSQNPNVKELYQAKLNSLKLTVK